MTMSNEDELLSEVEQIVTNAADQEQSEYTDYVVSVAKTVEERLYEEYGAEDTYRVFSLNLAFKGSPTTLEDWRITKEMEEPNAESIDITEDSHEVNSCLELESVWNGNQEGMPDEIYDVLEDKKAGLYLRSQRSNLVGSVVRSGAWASPTAKDKGIKPSACSDRKSVTVTIYHTGALMVALTRDDESGELIGDRQVFHVFEPAKDTKDKYFGNNVQIADKCIYWLNDTHGRLPSSIYGLWAVPAAIQMDDPEMYDALIKDVLLDKAKSDNNNNPQKEGSNDN
jgi:hypothetical protein